MPLQKGHKLNKPGRAVKQPSPMLQAYRHVFRTVEGVEDGEEHRLLRKVKGDNPEKFLDQLHRLEMAHQNKGSGSITKAPVEKEARVKEARDEGEERLEDLMKRLLEGWKNDEVNGLAGSVVVGVVITP